MEFFHSDYFYYKYIRNQIRAHISVTEYDIKVYCMLCTRMYSILHNIYTLPRYYITYPMFENK